MTLDRKYASMLTQVQIGQDMARMHSLTRTQQLHNEQKF